MTETLALLGTILFQAGAFAALVLATPALYGLVISMPRWWLVVAAAIVLVGSVGLLSFDPGIGEAITSLPEAMVPDTHGYATIAVAYVLLAVIVRLSTLRLEWRGWKRKAIKDIHVLGYLAPTLAAAAIVLPF